MQQEGALPEACSLPSPPAQPTQACTVKATPISSLKLSSQPLEAWDCPYQQRRLHMGIQVQEEAGTQAQGCLGRGFWSPWV